MNDAAHDPAIANLHIQDHAHANGRWDAVQIGAAMTMTPAVVVDVVRTSGGGMPTTHVTVAMLAVAGTAIRTSRLLKNAAPFAR